MSERKTSPENLYQRGGVWWIRYNINGELVRRSLGTESLREAKRLRNEIIGTRDAGADVRAKFGLGGRQHEGAPVPTFKQASDAWLDSERAQGKAAGSLRKARGTLRTWLLPTFGPRYLSDVTEAEVEHFVGRLRVAPGKGGRPLSDDTVANVFGYLRRIYKFARRRGLYVGADPTDLERKPRPGKGRDVYLSEDEASRLLEALRPESDQREAWRLYYMVAVALFAGLRWGEVNGLRWDELDLEAEQPSMRIRRSYLDGPLKSSASEAEVKLHSALAGLLRTWRDGATSEWLFPRKRTGRPLKKSGNADEQALADAGIRAKISKRVTPHVLRHTFGTQIYARTFDPKTLQTLMRHSRVSITMARYVHAGADQAQVVNALPDFTARKGVRLSEVRG